MVDTEIVALVTTTLCLIAVEDNNIEASVGRCKKLRKGKSANAAPNNCHAGDGSQGSHRAVSHKYVGFFLCQSYPYWPYKREVVLNEAADRSRSELESCFKLGQMNLVEYDAVRTQASLSALDKFAQAATLQCPQLAAATAGIDVACQ
jgi:hypothetical protein